MKTAKHLIIKVVERGKDPYPAILDFRNTPTPDKGASPAQYSLGGCTHTKVPMSSKLLQPQNISEDVAVEKKKFKNTKSK